MNPESLYQLQVLAYLGPVGYSSDTANISIVNQNFTLPEMGIVTATSNSFTVNWQLDPLNRFPVSGFRTWVTVGPSHNGYQSADNSSIYFSTELRKPGLSQRQILGSNMTSVTIAGCYQIPKSGSHCIQPWTVYTVFVQPFNGAFDGSPLSVVVKTASSRPLIPYGLQIV